MELVALLQGHVPGRCGPPRVHIDVNGIPHQTVVSGRSAGATSPIYFTPYERADVGSLDDVLIVGAGTGTTSPSPLRRAPSTSTPSRSTRGLQQIGPNCTRIARTRIRASSPYQRRPRLPGADRTSYDLILFALPDSLTLVAGQSSLRLESYLFTPEAMEAARDHLKPAGAFAMYNFYREDWLVDRLPARWIRSLATRPAWTRRDRRPAGGT